MLDKSLSFDNDEITTRYVISHGCQHKGWISLPFLSRYIKMFATGTIFVVCIIFFFFFNEQLFNNTVC